MFRSPKDISFKMKDKGNMSVNCGYSCDLCGQGPWPSELDVDIHRKKLHKSDLFEALKNKSISMCSICLRQQKDKKALVEHILVNHFCCPPNATMINREVYICDRCHHLFFNKELLISHMFHWHTKKTPKNSQEKQTCPVCSKSIRAKHSWFHLLHHGAFNRGTCPICLDTLENHDEMLEHLKTHPSVFRCNICKYETTRECYFNNHLAKHRTNIKPDKKYDASKFFLPVQLVASFKNSMTHIYKGIPMANEVKICVLCRALAFSVEEMNQHIFATHVPVEKEKSKPHLCLCGEEFFNSILLKHHIFKMKGNHGVCDGTTPISVSTDCEPQKIVNVYQVYEMSDPLGIGLNEIIIDISGHAASAENDSSDDG